MNYPTGENQQKIILDSLDKKLKAKMFREIDLLMENGSDLRMPHSRSEGDGIFELRAKQGSNICRVMYFFFIGKKAVITNGFVKKSERTPASVIELAKKYRRDYIYRIGNVIEGDPNE